MGLYSNVSTSSLPYYAFYIGLAESSVIMVLTIFIMVVIIAKQQFRGQKEYIILFINLLHEFFFSLGSNSAAIFRLTVYLNNTNIPFSNRGVCFQTLHVILMIITFPGSGLITLALALDRCLAVYVPLRYLSFSRRYAVMISSLGYSLVLPVFVYALISTYGNPDYGNVQIMGTCDFTGITYPTINEIVRATRASSTLIGMFLYIPITIKLRQVVRAKNHASGHSIGTAQLKKLMRYNFLVCLIILNEFILIILPDFIIIVWPDTPLKTILFALTLTKSLITVSIMLIAQKELRSQCYIVITCLFKCVTHTDVNFTQPKVFVTFKRTQNNTISTKDRIENIKNKDSSVKK